jgi:hypothetical protein
MFVALFCLIFTVEKCEPPNEPQGQPRLRQAQVAARCGTFAKIGYFRKPGLVFRHTPVPPQSTASPWSVITEREMKEQLRDVKQDLEFLRD